MHLQLVTFAAIASGGALGALLRFWVSSGIHHIFGRSFPYGTLTVNVLGSLSVGLLYVLFNEKFALAAHWRALLIVGVLGAFTTFSTFSIETLELLEKRDLLKALLNVILNVGLCVFAAWIGVLLARAL
ncbi:MAG: fluoride efflux transporter CrcB [Gammaproteobacteria bacterium]|nr:fluoride efflux transporter CrcB [Gammaproteobacteria bacterium]